MGYCGKGALWINGNLAEYLSENAITVKLNSHIGRSLSGNILADHSDVIWTAPVGGSNYTFIIDLKPGFNGLGKDSRTTRRQLFKFWIWCDLYKRFDCREID